jgi:hypothetical protein
MLNGELASIERVACGEARPAAGPLVSFVTSLNTPEGGLSNGWQ